MKKLEIRNYDTILIATKISALSFDQIDKFENLTGEEILPFEQCHKIQETKFSCPPPEKIFKKQIKTLDDQEEMQIKGTEDHGKSFKTLESNNQISSNKINVEFIKEKETKMYDLDEYKKVNRFIWRY